jgi:hypothetical protein
MKSSKGSVARPVVWLALIILLSGSTVAWKRPEVLGLPEKPVGLSSIEKLPGTFMDGRAEASPVVAKGRVVVMVAARHVSDTGPGLVFRDWETKEDIKEVEWPYRFASAVNDGEDILIVGSLRTKDGTEIGLLRLGSDLRVKEQRPLLQSAEVIPNTSLIFDGRRYVMAIEVESPKGGQFHPRFLVSSDLKDWKTLGKDMLPGEYAACPTIRYVDGWYYVFYLRSHKLAQPQDGLEYGFTTRVARTRDFQTFETERLLAAPVVLAPSAGESVNTSDLDLVEHEGRVYMVYNVGNQVSAGRLRTAVYNGTLAEMVSELW